jgi:hypothetical protein
VPRRHGPSAAEEPSIWWKSPATKGAGWRRRALPATRRSHRLHEAAHRKRSGTSGTRSKMWRGFRGRRPAGRDV